MSSKGWDKAYAKREADIAARTKSIVLIDGNTVLSVHTDGKEANQALCSALDLFFDQNPSAQEHAMNIVGCTIVPQPGQKLPYEVRL